MRAATIRNILCNPIYAGLLSNKGDLYQGIHQPIIDRELWEHVGGLLERRVRKRQVEAKGDLLDGIIWDCFGRRMRCDRQYKKCGWVAHYRSYQSEWAKLKGLSRVGIDARQAEQLVIGGIRSFLADPERLRPMMLQLGRHDFEKTAQKGAAAEHKFERLSAGQLRSVVRGLVSRIEVAPDKIFLVMRGPEIERFLDWDCTGLLRSPADKGNRNTFLLTIPYVKLVRRLKFIDFPSGTKPGLGSKPKAKLVSMVDEARKAMTYFESHGGDAPAELAARLGRDQMYFKKLLKVNYLAPDILVAIREGTQPPNLTRRHFTDVNLPLDWELQRELLGFPAPSAGVSSSHRDFIDRKPTICE